MLCVSLGNLEYDECERLARAYPFVELRLDTLDLDGAQTRSLCAAASYAIATCRAGTDRLTQQRELLTVAIEAGVKYIDVEVEVPEEQLEYLRDRAREHGVTFVVSYHNYEKTPPRDKLEQIIQQCFDKGADVAKIACRVENSADTACLLGLLALPRKLVVVGMGEKGRLSRVLAPSLGSLWTYAAPSSGKETAEGQLTAAECERAMRLLDQLS